MLVNNDGIAIVAQDLIERVHEGSPDVVSIILTSYVRSI